LNVFARFLLLRGIVGGKADVGIETTPNKLTKLKDTNTGFFIKTIFREGERKRVISSKQLLPLHCTTRVEDDIHNSVLDSAEGMAVAAERRTVSESGKKEGGGRSARQWSGIWQQQRRTG
jgi:hypothetical protein